MVGIVVGVLLLAVSAIFFFLRRRNQRELSTVQSLPLKTVKECEDTAAYIAQEIGAGDYHDAVKLKGELVSEEPLTAEFSGEACIFYRSRLTREFEEKVRRKVEGENRYVERWEKRSEVISENSRVIDAELDDGTGRIKVCMEGCDFEKEKIRDQVAGPDNPLSERYQGRGVFGPVNQRHIALIEEEWILPIHRPVFLAGMVTDRGGGLKIMAPKDPDLAFVLSLKDEYVYLQAKQKRIRNQLIGIWVAACLGGVSLIAGILTQMGVLEI